MQFSSFNKILNYLRESNFISKTKLAKELNVSRQLLATLESGHSVPNAELLLALADFFNVSVDYLLGRDGGVANNKKTHITVPDELTDEERNLVEDYAYFILNRREKLTKTNR